MAIDRYPDEIDRYPDEVDLRKLADAHGRLAENGIVAGANGYDLHTLAAALYRYGWSYRIDRPAGSQGYQAELHPQNGAARSALGSAIGWEPAVALSFALSKALEARKRPAATAGDGHRST